MVSQRNIIHIVFFVFILTYTLTIARYGTRLLNNKNILLHFSLWITAFAFSFYTDKAIYLLIPVILSILNEWIYNHYNRDLYHGQSRVKLFYDIATQDFVKANKGDINFTEGVYLDQDGQELDQINASKITATQSLERKFEELWRIMGLDQLSSRELSTISILDCGCGNGEFLRFCRERGAHATGLTISSEQAALILRNGDHVLEGSFTEFHNELIHQFDIIVFMGSLEHLEQGLPCHPKTRERQRKTWGHILQLCYHYFKKNSPYRYLFSSTLHLNPQFCGTWELNTLERAFGGAYQFNSLGDRLRDISEAYGYETIYSRDMTYHYYMSSMVGKNHFGRPMKLTSERVLVGVPGCLFIHPSIYFMIMYGYHGLWMWQFDGKPHLYNEGMDTCKLLPQEDRPATLWWDIMKCPL